MAKITKEEVLAKRMDFLTVKEYCEKYGNNISPQAIYYAMDKDLIDEFTPARERFVVMTEKTKNYVPNASPKRTKMSL